MISPVATPRRILAVDPGPVQSAFVVLRDGAPIQHGTEPNHSMLPLLSNERRHGGELAVEMIASYGMPVGSEVFETCVWIGRFIQAWGGPFRLVYRIECKQHLCRDSRAKDSNIRAALIDRFGPGREKAIGTKRAPGPLYGVSGDVWAAIAVAVTAAETNTTRKEVHGG